MANGKPGRPAGRTYPVKTHTYLTEAQGAELDRVQSDLGLASRSEVLRHAWEVFARSHQPATAGSSAA
jgi:metal-responsive CopG/Arc/MetJ family transcriptional regulator